MPRSPKSNQPLGLVITGLAVVFGLVGLVRGAPSSAAIPHELAAGAVVRATGVDAVASSRDLPSTVRFEPQWVRGVPRPAGAVVTRGDSPLPQSDFVLAARADGWVRWELVEPPAAPTGPRARFTFAEHLGQATVTVGGSESGRVCNTWIFGKWQCGPDPWNYVGEADVQVRGRMQHCIWAHPSDEGSLSLEFTDVPLGTMISGRHMLGDVGVSNQEEGEISLRIFVDGELVGDRVQQQRAGLNTFRFTLDEPPEVGDVRFEIDAEVTAQRHFCFTAQTRTVSTSTTRSRPAVEFDAARLEHAVAEGSGAEGSGAERSAAEGSADTDTLPEREGAGESELTVEDEE